MNLISRNAMTAAPVAAPPVSASPFEINIIHYTSSHRLKRVSSKQGSILIFHDYGEGWGREGSDILQTFGSVAQWYI
ncbi:hypothetical protein PHLGIDRAFT_221342 [Phlebiopsis gigantea 11061_1 CR5-6]|uniref:Uncharacterized protein n=1 Tax=Phlebiopsis gigantea (strain 11061_1 CR5-6) TaxID=745531 RepID=A0A0C3PT18_PHLG1|nr:hypothetical protein PHLGIDRAFT_221342 [Phlebiopsis gigantea 11061_1 CR5-6]